MIASPDGQRPLDRTFSNLFLQNVTEIFLLIMPATKLTFLQTFTFDLFTSNAFEAPSPILTLH